MYSNGPVRPMPGFLNTPTRPMGGAPTTYITPPPPAPVQAQGTLISNSPAGPSVMANLQALGLQVWSAVKSILAKAMATVQRALA